MNTIGFQASVVATPQDKEADAPREYSLVVREDSVARVLGDAESDLAFACCLWGSDEGAGVGLHLPNGPKALAGHLAMILVHDKTLRTVLFDACRAAELIAAARGED